MNKNKLYFGLMLFFLITFLPATYATDKTMVIRKDSMILIENTITQNLIMQGQNGISPQNLVYDEKSKVFYVLNQNNISLDIIDYSNPDSLKFVNKIDLSQYGKTLVSVAFSNKIVGITIENEIFLDSGKVVFLNEKGEFLKAFAVAPYVKSIAFDQDGKKVYVSNFNPLGYTINIIDISKGIENLTKAKITTLTYEKEKAGDAFVLLDPFGIGMTMIAMSIVFMALILLYLIFKYIGHLNTSGSRKKSLVKKGKIEEASRISEDAPGDVYAAIALALHLYQTQMHDEENTVITMEKVARSYSPWSSKIYGLRQTPKN
jgi:Na+-transporting methylmalonyl-CoA/oxaloacetate decarboxylase gamma subunit